VAPDEPILDMTRELDVALDALEASMSAHRTLESVLLAILANVPLALVVTDRERVRAASTRAEETWGARTGTRVAVLPDEVRRAVQAALGGTGGGSGDPGLRTAVVDEPGTGERYVLVVDPRTTTA
jgi:hypothetical protein